MSVKERIARLQQQQSEQKSPPKDIQVNRINSLRMKLVNNATNNHEQIVTDPQALESSRFTLLYRQYESYLRDVGKLDIRLSFREWVSQQQEVGKLEKLPLPPEDYVPTSHIRRVSAAFSSRGDMPPDTRSTPTSPTNKLSSDRLSVFSSGSGAPPSPSQPARDASEPTTPRVGRLSKDRLSVLSASPFLQTPTQTQSLPQSQPQPQPLQIPVLQSPGAPGSPGRPLTVAQIQQIRRQSMGHTQEPEPVPESTAGPGEEEAGAIHVTRKPKLKAARRASARFSVGGAAAGWDSTPEVAAAVAMQVVPETALEQAESDPPVQPEVSAEASIQPEAEHEAVQAAEAEPEMPTVEVAVAESVLAMASAVTVSVPSPGADDDEDLDMDDLPVDCDAVTVHVTPAPESVCGEVEVSISTNAPRLHLALPTPTSASCVAIAASPCDSTRAAHTDSHAPTSVFAYEAHEQHKQPQLSAVPARFSGASFAVDFEDDASSVADAVNSKLILELHQSPPAASMQVAAPRPRASAAAVDARLSQRMKTFTLNRFQSASAAGAVSADSESESKPSAQPQAGDAQQAAPVPAAAAAAPTKSDSGAPAPSGCSLWPWLLAAAVATATLRYWWRRS